MSHTSQAGAVSPDLTAVKTSIHQRKICVLSSCYSFLIPDDNIKRISVYFLFEFLLKLCSLVTCTEKT